MTEVTQERKLFRAQDRITRQAEFDRCHTEGRRFQSGRFVLLHYLKSSGARRLGVVVSKKTGGAVVRNRWRRVIRETFRLNRGILPTASDDVVIVRKSVQGKPDASATKELIQLFMKVNQRS